MNVLSAVLLPLVFQLLLCVSYYFYGQKHYAVYGYQQLLFDIYFFIGIAISTVYSFAFFANPSRLAKPSGFFLLFYSFIVFYPYVVLHGIWGRTGLYYLFDLALLLIPVVFVISARNISISLPKIYFYSERSLLICFAVFAALFSLYFIFNSTGSASFSIEDVYSRRLEARELYGSRTIIAYSSSIISNGLIPFFMFIGIVSRRLIFCFFSIAVYIVFYYVFGVKAPLIYMQAAFCIAILLMYFSLDKFFKVFPYVAIVVVLASIVEFLVLGSIYLEGYLVRRIFYVSSYLIGAYFELFYSQAFSKLFGLGLESMPASIYMGEIFLSSEGLNANTNTFLYYLIQYGLAGYLFSCTLVSLCLVWFDSMRHHSEAYIFLAFLFSMLVIEQSVTTVLLSSGIGVILFFYYFAGNHQYSKV